MRVLVTWGSKHGGTAGIGTAIAEVLSARAFDVVAKSVDEVGDIGSFEAVIVGGGLYANRWVNSARRFVSRHQAQLRRVPVWLFSSGPLDDSADRSDIPPPSQVAMLGERVGAKGHATFGGRLDPDVKGFPAAAMAKEHAGDFRNLDRVRAWAETIAEQLPDAVPGQALDHPARALSYWLGYGFFGATLSGAFMTASLRLVGLTPTLVLHAFLAPALFTFLAVRYFKARGARDPLPTAIAWTSIVIALDLLLAGGIERSFEMFRSFAGAWLPYCSVFIVTWITGFVISTMPWPKPAEGGKNRPLKAASR